MFRGVALALRRRSVRLLTCACCDVQFARTRRVSLSIFRRYGRRSECGVVEVRMKVAARVGEDGYYYVYFTVHCVSRAIDHDHPVLALLNPVTNWHCEALVFQVQRYPNWPIPVSSAVLERLASAKPKRVYRFMSAFTLFCVVPLLESSSSVAPQRHRPQM